MPAFWRETVGESGPKMTNPSGVLHFNLARGWRGGEQQTWMLMRELAARGYHQGLCAHVDAPLAQKVAQEPWSARVFSPAALLLNPNQAEGFNVGHAHDGRGAYLAWRWATRTRRKYIITRRMQNPPKKKFLTQKVYSSATVLVGISRSSCFGLHQLAGGQDIRNIPSAFSPVPESGSANKTLSIPAEIELGSTVIGHAGALVDAHKGQKLLIDAVSRLRDRGMSVSLVLMGDGPDRPALVRHASHNQWLHVVGHLTPISSYLGSIDIFAFPSRYEGLGSVLLDVMLAGVPIVASDVGGIPDIIKAGHTGMLIPPNDPGALEESLFELIMNPLKASQLAQAAQRAVTQFSPSAMSASYESIYSEISGRS